MENKKPKYHIIGSFTDGYCVLPSVDIPKKVIVSELKELYHKRVSKEIRKSFLKKYKMPFKCIESKEDFGVKIYCNRYEYLFKGEVFMVLNTEVLLNDNLNLK